MQNYSYSTLEFEKLLELVSRHAQTPMAIDRFADLRPITNQKALERDLRAISETISLNEEKQVSWYFTELTDPESAIAILKIRNATLEPTILLELTKLCTQALSARSIIQPEKEFVPVLWQIVENLPKSLLETVERINKKLLPSGEIDDSASPELARLRREINLQRNRLTKSLESVMRDSATAVQDAIVTVRNDRFVIPVKADFRGKIGGVAHGFSSSGATVFIEPLESIEANNELQSLKGKEEREVARILFALTEDMREQLPAIEMAVEAVAELDFIKAKVEFARKFAATIPEISQDETLELTDARHPLLEENLRGTDHDIVPVSFMLTKEKGVMIISGANAGGKTVVLKTAGLLSMMAISGLPVPAKAARIPFYRSILADIGDHQSLAANLSTFSSHMSNIAEMLRECTSPSLVLLDEAGTGTDPEEGSALGVAIVDHFRRKCNAQVIASTHYRGLKIYAANDPSVINASVEFNEKTLQPTYKLLIGLAGASSGIEIARRFGILPEVIEEARQNLDISAQEAENYLRKLQTETTLAVDLRVALEEEREATAMKYASLEMEASKKEKERQRQFEKELAQTIEEFDRQSKTFVQSIEDKALKTRLEKERQTRKAELNKAVLTKFGKGAAAGGTSTAQPVTINRPISVGAKVLTSFGNVGVVEKMDNEVAEVLVGGMRLREKIVNLRSVVQEEKSGDGKLEKLQKGAKDTNLRLDVPDMDAELNLIGFTTADAEYELDRFLDEAYLAALPRIRIIHGFGTGALKNFVHHFLKGHPHVSKYAFAPQDQGGNGATIAELKQ
jgi:DNA mismatch repair protein MutS2